MNQLFIHSINSCDVAEGRYRYRTSVLMGMRRIDKQMFDLIGNSCFILLKRVLDQGTMPSRKF